MKKRCITCHVLKEEVAFHIKKNGSLAKTCNRCVGVKSNYSKVNKANKKRYDSIYHKKNLEKHHTQGKKYYWEHKETTLRDYFQSPKGKFAIYKGGAKQRGIEFRISLEEFKSFVGSPCFYCGSEMNYIALDRVNNDFGYSKENCVSCCTICNLMKRTFSKDIFIEYCLKIVRHQKLI